ncbi:MAG: Ig-like domain-containing protein [Streptococcus sp.]
MPPKIDFPHYTDYVEKHSDTNGSFFFYARIDFQKHLKKEKSQLKLPLTTR